MSHEAHVELKHDVFTSSTRIRVLDGVDGVPTEEVVELLESSCRASGVGEKIMDIHPLTGQDETGCRVRFGGPLQDRDEIHIRDALRKGGFLCV